MEKQSGSGLIFAVVLLFVILGMVITLSSITVLETKMSQKTKSSIGAFYNSESGVEWALNKIATGTGTNISNLFGATPPGNGFDCPTGGCKVYLLDKDGIVITSNLTIDQVKAVRSVGTQDTGEVTQRAIEAAVASGGGCGWHDFDNVDSTGHVTADAMVYKCVKFSDLIANGATGSCYVPDWGGGLRWGDVMALVAGSSIYQYPSDHVGEIDYAWAGCGSGDGLCGVGNSGPRAGGVKYPRDMVVKYYGCK